MKLRRSLTVWKPALGGRLVVPITSTSPVQIATIRPGVLPVRSHRTARRVDIERLPSGPARASVTVLSTHRIDAGRAALAQAKVVVAVGQGVQPDHYDQLQPLLSALGGAEMAATRKVTDRGWMPRSRQIGVTGLSVGPRLFVSIGASGRFNHATGFQTARVVLALNIDPSADVFGVADVGLIGPWSDSVRALVATLESDQRIVSALTDIVPSPDA